ncbi:TVP38/TMEM64 family protein [Geodermatophilus sp. SYSU D00703]
MSGYVLVVAVLAGSALLLFGLVEWSAWPLLTDPSPVMHGAGIAAALLGVGLLTADVFLPVPSSVVMMVHGALFGVVPAAALSLVGGVSGTVVGFALGRRGRRVLERVTTPSQRLRADRLLTRWGPWAVVLSRAVPVLAETVAVLAGTSSMRWSVLALAGATGTALPACLYAALGAGVGTLVGALLACGLVLAFSGLLAVTGGRLHRSSPPARRQEGW